MWKVLVQTYVFNYLCVYLEVELLGHMITLCLTIWGKRNLFYKVAAYIPIRKVWRFQFFHVSIILAGMKWCFIAVLWKYFKGYFPWIYKSRVTIIFFQHFAFYYYYFCWTVSFQIFIGFLKIKYYFSSCCLVFFFVLQSVIL